MIERIKQNKLWALTVLIGATAVATGVTISLLNNPEFTEMELILNRIIESEEAYFETHNTYWQGLGSDSRIPLATEKLVPNRLDSKPHYQKESWRELVSLPIALSFQVEVHKYQQADGQQGYQVFFRRMENGMIKHRSFGFGPEKESRTWDWQLTDSTLKP